MSIEARTAFDRLLSEGEQQARPLQGQSLAETDEARIVRQNREAVKSWAGAGVPMPVMR